MPEAFEYFVLKRLFIPLLRTPKRKIQKLKPNAAIDMINRICSIHKFLSGNCCL